MLDSLPLDCFFLFLIKNIFLFSLKFNFVLLDAPCWITKTFLRTSFQLHHTAVVITLAQLYLIWSGLKSCSRPVRGLQWWEPSYRSGGVSAEHTNKETFHETNASSLSSYIVKHLNYWLKFWPSKCFFCCCCFSMT